MASSLPTISTPWIEDLFIDAASFHPRTACSNGPRWEKEKKDLRQEPDLERRTGNIVPQAVTSSAEVNGGRAANETDGGSARSTTSATSLPRGGTIARVLRIGGDFRHYENYEHDGPRSCPPYLILHDGKHSAAAFLSPETLAGIVGGDDDGDDGSAPQVEDIESALVEISGYCTVSTVLRCTFPDPVVHERIVRELRRWAPISRRHTRRHINRQLFMCMYLQSPVAFVRGGAEGEMADFPVDVHRSAPLRRALIDHQNKYPSDADAGGNGDGDIQEERSHSMLIRRLEARHCIRQLLTRDERAPQWPWESRLILPGEGECETSRNDIRPTKQEGTGNRGQFAAEDAVDAAMPDGPAGGDADEEVADSSPSGNVEEDKPGIVEMVNVNPDLTSDRCGGAYTDKDLLLVDWIRKNTDRLRVLREKLSHSYRLKARSTRTKDVGDSSSVEPNTTDVAGEEKMGRREVRDVLKRLRSETYGEVETSLARNRPRRSLSRARMKEFNRKGSAGCGKNKGRGEDENRRGSGRANDGSNAGREGSVGRAKRRRADDSVKGGQYINVLSQEGIPSACYLWEQKFNLLKEFHHQYGHCDVPRSQGTLGNWVRNQRTGFSHLNGKNKTSTSVMTPDRIEKLESLGFKWTIFLSWETNYQKLLSYKQETGSCDVPRKYSEDQALSNWVNNQRAFKKAKDRGEYSSLTDDREAQLDKVGFVWAKYKGGK